MSSTVGFVSPKFREVHTGDINWKSSLINGIWSHETERDKSPRKQGVGWKPRGVTSRSQVKNGGQGAGLTLVPNSVDRASKMTPENWLLDSIYGDLAVALMLGLSDGDLWMRADGWYHQERWLPSLHNPRRRWDHCRESRPFMSPLNSLHLWQHFRGTATEC